MILYIIHKDLAVRGRTSNAKTTLSAPTFERDCTYLAKSVGPVTGVPSNSCGNDGGAALPAPGTTPIDLPHLLGRETSVAGSSFKRSRECATGVPCISGTLDPGISDALDLGQMASENLTSTRGEGAKPAAARRKRRRQRPKRMMAARMKTTVMPTAIPTMVPRDRESFCACDVEESAVSESIAVLVASDVLSSSWSAAAVDLDADAVDVDADAVDVDADAVDVNANAVDVDADAVDVDADAVDVNADAVDVDADAVDVDADAVDVNADAVDVNADAVDVDADAVDVDADAVDVDADAVDVDADAVDVNANAVDVDADAPVVDVVWLIGLPTGREK